MLIGRRYKLERDILALENVAGKRLAVTIPTGEIIKVVAVPETGDGMVDVLWNGRIFELFEVDADARSTQIQDRGAKA